MRPADTFNFADSLIRVLLIEDDDRLAELMSHYLQTHQILVTRVANGTSGLEEALRNQYDLVLLDLMLPGLDGISVCRELRSRCDVPIFVLTARGEEAERVLGLEVGADDYIVKPFSSPELLARVRAHVRRARGQVGPSNKMIRVGPLTLDPSSLRATLNGKTLQLTGYEFTLLRVLAERSGRILGREQLLDLAKGSAEEAFDRSIDGHISRLRHKIEEDPKNPRLLKTVRGVGYVLTATSDEEQ